MRQRGGSISDIAILIVDISQGVQKQTIESLEILISNKIPFIVALNKVDLLNGWKPQKTTSILQSIKNQNQRTIELLEERTYSIIAELSKIGLNFERFDRVEDFTKQILVVPCSAKTGEGISELILYLAGLCQKYLANSLEIEEQIKQAKGTIIEVKQEKGLGLTLDVILYEGILRKNDFIAFAKETGAAKTKVRGILRLPYPEEKIDKNQKYVYVDEICAAAGVKIYAPELEGALAGSPFYTLKDEQEFEKIAQEINQTLKRILVDEPTQKGVLIKTDTLGSAEAFLNLLKSKNIPIKKIGLGQITKKDVLDAYATKLLDKYYGVILGFNVNISNEATLEAQNKGIKIFNSQIIFESMENYLKWVEEERKNEIYNFLCSISHPVKIKILPNCFFRFCKPAIFGVEVLAGKLKQKTILIKTDGKIIGEIKTIQNQGQTIEQAIAGQKVAIAIDECHCQKDLKELEILYSYIPKDQIKIIKEKCLDAFSADEKAILEEIEKIVK
jgi:translation initiation factor 5B